MKKMFFVFSALAIFAAFGYDYAEAGASGSMSDTLIQFQSSDDQSLGSVNLCDPNGKTCIVGDAFKDSSNGRVYVVIGSYDGSYRFYAQKSNDSRWEYMILYGGNWLYFSF